MKMEILVITPEMARACLDRNKIQNRTLRQPRVDAIANDITNGLWQVTHQGIAFDNDGNLIDGQHRLAACCQAGIPIKTYVCKGVSINVSPAIDNVAPRSITDHSKQMGDFTVSTSHSAIAQCIEFGAGHTHHLSVNQRLALIDKYRPAIDFAVKACGSSRGFQAPSKAVVARAYYTCSHERLKRFMEIYRSEVPTSKEETAPLVLKRFLTGQNLAGWTGREESYRKTESALSFFLKGTPMSKVVGTEKELFPIPSTN